MQVFKAFMKVTKKRLHVFLVYISIFVAIGVLMTMEQEEESFESYRVTAKVTDLDNTESSRALADYIGSIADIKEGDISEDEVKDTLFYRSAEVILTIEKGFEEKLSVGDTENLFTEYNIPGTYSAELFDSQINRYINMINACTARGMSMKEAFKEAQELSAVTVDTEVLTFSDDIGKEFDTNAGYFYQYIPYIIISIFITGICPSILTFRAKGIGSRMNCSCVSPVKQLAQIVLGTVILALGVYLILILAATVLYGDTMFTSAGKYAMINSITMVIFGTMLTMFLSVVIKKAGSLSMAAQVIGLGSSFLCGVFVPQELLGDTVLSIGRFLPIYWYVKANNMLAGWNNEVFTQKEFALCIGVQLAFTMALFLVTLVISRSKASSKQIS